MPRNVIATGIVNFVAPISRLVELMTDTARSKQAVRSLDAGTAADDLRRIVGFLRSKTGHDFSSYKRATVMRRVLRRMQVRRIASMEAYGELVRNTPEEAQELFNDLLISVTHFFRDVPAFEALAAKVLPPMFEDVEEEGLRVWSAGCATGEEAYSLAILMLEEAGRRNAQVPMQIFASDLDEGALATAREGRYPRSIEADVTEERLQRFFVDEGTHYRVRKELRDVVLFASHSVLRDPPFLRMDLVACRNLLIYLERSLQEQLLGIFHYGLRPNGCLFLGSAETADGSAELFAPLDRDARLYRARPRSRRQMPALPQVAADFGNHPAETRSTAARKRPEEPATQHAAALERSAPPSVLVDDAQRIVHLSPSAGRFILHSAGAFSGTLPDVVRPELRLDLRIALDEALDRRQPRLTLATAVEFDGGPRRIAMQAAPVAGEGNEAPQALVVFLDAGPVSEDDEPEIEPAAVDAGMVRRLHGELRAAQQALVASRGEHETAMEDLRAANEELQSINEEYRSTSEELETSKEELQSMNEELQTVNAELKHKLDGISTAHGDLQNLIAATEIGTLFLDPRLRIRMFTPPMTALFNITGMDVGRAITDFTSRLLYDAVEDDARRVLRDLAPIETEVRSRDDRWFIIRLRPYRTVEDRIDGVVLTFVDITSRREMERKLRESRENYHDAVQLHRRGLRRLRGAFRGRAGGGLSFHRGERRVRASDRPARRRRQDCAGADLRRPRSTGSRSTAASPTSGDPERFEAPAKALGKYYDVYAFRVGDPEKHRVGALFRDVSERKEAEAQREMLTAELSHRVKNTLAVVQALARSPGAPDQTVEQYRDRLTGRIRALARAHDQLLETHWQSADLKALIDATLAAYGGNGRRDVVSADGPDVRLTPKQGLGLALILHELATNASKYGSLSVDGGNLSLAWEREGAGPDDPIRLTWRETGGPKVHGTTEDGFGTKLIKQVCAYELDGSAELKFDPDGLVVEITFPNG